MQVASSESKSLQGYHEVDQKLHVLTQLIAKVNRTYISSEADDSHTNFEFEPQHNCICGRFIGEGGRKVRLAFNLTNQVFQWRDESDAILRNHPIVNRTFEDIEAELASELDKFGFNTMDFAKAMHYEIPGYDFSSSPFKRLDESHLKGWSYYRALANSACTELATRLEVSGEPRIWPHHFDTGIYFQINDLFEIGFGLGMQDDMVGEAYFYMAGYSNGPALNFENLPSMSFGRWITGEGWKGAVLPLGELASLNSQKALAALDDYINASTSWYLKQ